MNLSDVSVWQKARVFCFSSRCFSPTSPSMTCFVSNETEYTSMTCFVSNKTEYIIYISTDFCSLSLSLASPPASCRLHLVGIATHSLPSTRTISSAVQLMRPPSDNTVPPAVLLLLLLLSRVLELEPTMQQQLPLNQTRIH